MRIGLIGGHPDGVAAARALASAGHTLAAFAGPADVAVAGAERFTDLEAILSQRDLELLIVADEFAHRPDTLRRAMQSDRHVLCVHPADLLPDITYEVAMIQEETHKLLLPLLPARLSPAFVRLRTIMAEGPLELLQWELPVPPPLTKGGIEGGSQAAPGWDGHPLVWLWDVLRLLGGEVRDVSATGAVNEELRPGDPLTLTGRFEQAGSYRVLLTPGQQGAERLHVRGARGDAELRVFPDGRMELRSPSGEVEVWESWDRWRAFAEQVNGCLAGAPPAVSWQDGTRCLELFEATRQSVKRRRVVPMYYEEFTETSNFKGVMASLGCGVLVLGLLILVVLLLIKVPLQPWLLFLLLPLFLLFLVLQFLRWLVPEKQGSDTAANGK